MRRRALSLSILASVSVLVAAVLPPTAAATAATREAAVTTGASASSVIAAAPAAAPGWTTLFADDFSGAAGAPVSSKWVHELGTWGTGAVDVTTASTANVFLDGTGALSIRALQDASRGWTSGRIITAQKNFAAPAGGQLLMTAAVRLPNPEQAVGYWPAFWALGLDGAGNIDWPRTGEIDMLEAVNGRSELFQTLHCDLVDGGSCNEPYGLTSGPQPCDGCLTSFHTYSALIDRTTPGAERVQFFVDGVVRHTIEQSAVAPAAWSAFIANNYFLILNLAIGGGLPNGACGCDSAAAPKTSGGTMSVDSVAVYQKPSASTTVSLQRLSSTPTPKIRGTVAVGKTVTVDAGTWRPAPVTLSYQWLRNGREIPGATAGSFAITSVDAKTTLSVRVTGQKTGYTTVATTSSGTRVR
jgi:beta-glucanase (GH16 family)